LRAPAVLRSIIPSFAGVLLVLALVGPVLAHSELVSSDPPDKAVLATPPTVITLTFSENLDPAKSSFKLVGPAGTVGAGAVGGDPTLMTLGNLDLAPGDYEIQWTSAALDGDILRGTLTFSVSEPTPAPATPTPGPSATILPSADSSVAPSVAPTPIPSAAPAEPASSSGDVVLPIVAALALVAVIGVTVLRRSRRA
jgi:methionine-rich copper-binding protein CopC